MKILYFDICSIPLFLMILFVCYSRKMTKGNANRLFVSLVYVSLFCSVTDLIMETAENTLPMSEAALLICTISTYLYLLLRNATNAVLLLFLLHLTKTSFLIRSRWIKLLYSLPYGFVVLMLAVNPFTHEAFRITAQEGYSRGPIMLAFYGTALLYGLVGLAYCIYCRRYLPLNKWASLLTIYILGHSAVVVQFFHPEIMLEMFCTAVGEMVVMLSIMRPEERMDVDVGMLSWASYKSDLKNIILSGEQVRIVVISLQGSREIRNYLGDQRYNEYLSRIADGIRAIPWKNPRRIDLYYERPGNIYIITAADEEYAEKVAERLLSESGGVLADFAKAGVRFGSRVCLIRCPQDLQRAEDIISLGHKFEKISGSGETVVYASDIVSSEHFAIESGIEKILDRAIREGNIRMYYQPIYDVPSGRFTSAEALARIIDPEYGLISPGVFIPAAEAQGVMITVGDEILEQSFRFISEHDLDALGLSYIEINLSVAQCLESSLPDKIRALQEKYGVDPARVNLEITETTFASISEVMLENVNELIRMGYSFALDDYGIGYSSIQRVNRIPLRLIKIDKSMLEEIASENGKKIMQHTVRMMQSIGKQVVVEGAETREEVNALTGMACDHIQGFYFSRPLPEEDFVSFIREKNSSGG